MTFQPEPWATAEPEIREMVGNHWKELAVFKDRMHLDVNWDHYRQCEERGILQLTTARTTLGKLAGYWISIVNIHPHYQATKAAFQDSYFLLPQYRKANVGLALMIEMQKNVKAMGAEVIIGSDKEHLSMQPLFEYLGFMSPGKQYMKWIGGD